MADTAGQQTTPRRAVNVHTKRSRTRSRSRGRSRSRSSDGLVTGTSGDRERPFSHTHTPHVMTDVRTNYMDRAHEHESVSLSQRRAFDTAPVRYMNNFVKACVLDVAVRTAAIMLSPAASRDGQHAARGGLLGLRVLDLACGRGQDVSKLMYAADAARVVIEAYDGVDLLEDDHAARERAARYLAATRHVHIASEDIRHGFPHIPSNSVDTVSCQLAWHYLYDSPSSLNAVLAAVKRVLRTTGVFVVSFTDGRSILRRARDAMTGPPGDGTDICVEGRHWSFRIPSRHVTSSGCAGFGKEYIFTLPGSVHGVKEYLCSEHVLAAAAADAGLYAGPSLYFDEAVVRYCDIPYYCDIADRMHARQYLQDPDALDTANMYRMAVFAPRSTTLRTWDACSAAPSRTTTAPTAPNALASR